LQFKCHDGFKKNSEGSKFNLRITVYTLHMVSVAKWCPVKMLTGW